METLGTLLHIVAWYGTVLLVLVAMLTGIGMTVSQSVRAALKWLKHLSKERLWKGVLCLPVFVILALAVIAGQNGGEFPRWLNPPAVSSLWAGDTPDSAAPPASEGVRP
ncbi:hypothetical protein [Tautonia marina]|uniref:hypothetical protein n=1 Tax=Tautonia marina TaxID=2653855 RepID=UPI0012613842|nr:hypothetical protein [Tautonia marina]